MCAIEIMESILGSTSLVVNSCDSISALRQVPIHPEAVTSRWKQAVLIYLLSDIYHVIDSGMFLVYVYRNHNSGKLAPTLTSLTSLNVQIDTLAEHIMGSFLLSPATKDTMAIGLSYPYILPNLSICEVLVRSNLAQSIAYKISKRQLPQ